MARQQEEDSGKGIGDRKRRMQEVDSKVDILHTLHILTCYMPSISAHTAYAFLHMLFVVYVFHTPLHVRHPFLALQYIFCSRTSRIHPPRRILACTLSYAARYFDTL